MDIQKILHIIDNGDNEEVDFDKVRFNIFTKYAASFISELNLHIKNKYNIEEIMSIHYLSKSISIAGDYYTLNIKNLTDCINDFESKQQQYKSKAEEIAVIMSENYKIIKEKIIFQAIDKIKEQPFVKKGNTIKLDRLVSEYSTGLADVIIKYSYNTFNLSFRFSLKLSQKIEIESSIDTCINWIVENAVVYFEASLASHIIDKYKSQIVEQYNKNKSKFSYARINSSEAFKKLYITKIKQLKSHEIFNYEMVKNFKLSLYEKHILVNYAVNSNDHELIKLLNHKRGKLPKNLKEKLDTAIILEKLTGGE